MQLTTSKLHNRRHTAKH
uniref:Uncharacterized protein n=1 Tax=Anguilla anguilla TaxID=7936 RepID=A0A0E9XZZ3_ANGAN